MPHRLPFTHSTNNQEFPIHFNYNYTQIFTSLINRIDLFPAHYQLYLNYKYSVIYTAITSTLDFHNTVH